LSKVKHFETVIRELFRSGADIEHNAHELLGLLVGIDFEALLQALWRRRETVYAYITEGAGENSFSYRGPELFLVPAMLLYSDIDRIVSDVAEHSVSDELWLLSDISLAVVSCVRTEIAGNASCAEYRAVKGTDWRETELCIDFPDLADGLDIIIQESSPCRCLYAL